MSPPRERSGGAAERRFLLERAPDAGEPRLEPGDAEHALRVLRLVAGDPLVGLDRRGRAWPLVVRAAARHGQLELEPAGEPSTEPEPGAAGSPLPWLELWVSPPRAARLETLAERLVQLGASALVPLLLERTPPGARRVRPERLARIADEALKQSGRLWPLELAGEMELGAALAARAPAGLIVLEPRAGRALWTVLEDLERHHGGASPFPRARPLAIVVGPEGGFSPPELEQLMASGARPARLAHHVLRVETAAEAAAAIALHRSLARAAHPGLRGD